MSNNFEGAIQYYNYYVIDFILESGLCIGDKSEITDNDVIIGSDGKPYITGTSIAGALRDYLDCLPSGKSTLLMGPDSKNGEAGKISPLIVHHANFHGEAEIMTRDGIKLDDYKQTVDKAKHDYQVVAPFTKGQLLLELVVRDDKLYEYQKQLELLLGGCITGEIRFGSKKTRGLGKISIDQVVAGKYSTGQSWWEFDYNPSVLPKVDTIKEMVINGEFLECYSKDEVSNYKPQLYSVYQIDAELSYGLAVRTYSSLKDDVDYKQMTVKRGDSVIPVIPGTSINGAFRHGMKKILVELIPMINTQINQDVSGVAEKLLNEAFGEADENGAGVDKSQEKSEAKNEKDSTQAEKASAVVSKIIIDDAYVKNSVLMTTTRSAINRFDGSTKNGALYTSKPAFKGDTTFRFYFPIDNSLAWAEQLLKLALIDMNYGYLTIGGETAIGRGIYKNIKIDGKDKLSQEVEANNLIQKIKDITPKVEVNHELYN